jgi:hypothetical protein
VCELLGDSALPISSECSQTVLDRAASLAASNTNLRRMRGVRSEVVQVEADGERVIAGSPRWGDATSRCVCVNLANARLRFAGGSRRSVVAEPVCDAAPSSLSSLSSLPPQATISGTSASRRTSARTRLTAVPPWLAGLVRSSYA